MAKQRNLKRGSSNQNDSENTAADNTDSALVSAEKAATLESAPESSEPVEPKPKDGEEKTYCICNLPNNPSHFYIGCDKCEEWYHGKCVKINEEFAKFIDKYFCFRCLNNKSPSQGKFILKSHLVNNDEIYVKPLNSDDPNMYYGFNPNKTAVTSRQKKLQITRWKERKHKKTLLTQELAENEKEQRALKRRLLKRRAEAAAPSPEPNLRPEKAKKAGRKRLGKGKNDAEKGKKRGKSRKKVKNAEKSEKITEKIGKTDRKIEKTAEKIGKTDRKSEKTAEKLEKPTEKSEKTAEKLEKTTEKSEKTTEKLEKTTEKSEKTAEKREKSPDPKPAAIETEIALLKLQRRQSELRVLLCDFDELATESSMRSLNKDVDSTLRNFVPEPAPAPAKKGATESEFSLNGFRKAARKDEKAAEKAAGAALKRKNGPNNSGAKNGPNNSGANPAKKGRKRAKPAENEAGSPGKGAAFAEKAEAFGQRAVPSAQTPPFQRFGGAPSALQSLDIFSLGRAPADAGGEGRAPAGVEDSVQRIAARVAKTRAEAKARFAAVPGAAAALAAQLEAAAFAATASRCNFWFDDTDWHCFSPALEDTVRLERNEGFFEEKSFKINPYTQFVNRCLVRLNKFRHLRQSLFSGTVNPAYLIVMTSKHVNEIEKIGRYRKKSRDLFEPLLGEETSELLEKKLFETFGKEKMSVYTRKSREILLNLNQNELIAAKLKSGEVSPEELCELDESEAGGPELAQWRQSMEEQALKGRIRETQKQLEKESAKNSENAIINNPETKSAAMPIVAQEEDFTDLKHTEPASTKKIKSANEHKAIVNAGYFRSSIFHNEEMFRYPDEAIWSGTVSAYSKSNVVDLNAFDVNLFQMGGPSVERLPFAKGGTLKMAGRTDVERVFGYIKEMLQNPGLSKVPMAFEVRPVNEDILDDYSNFCSYFMAIKRSAVFLSAEKDFTLYFVPPDMPGLPTNPIRSLLRCAPHISCEGCIWAFGYFQSFSAFWRYSRLKAGAEEAEDGAENDNLIEAEIDE